MFQDKSWKPIYFGVKMAKVTVTKRKERKGKERESIYIAPSVFYYA